MSKPDVLPHLKDDPTLSEVKTWSAKAAQTLSDAFCGHNKASILIVVSILYEVVGKSMISDCQSEIMDAVNKDKLNEEEKEKLQEFIERMFNDEDEDEDGPHLGDALSLSNQLGEVLAQCSVAKAMGEAVSEVNIVKMMTASALLTSDERANSIDELGWVFGYDDMSPEDKRDLRNRLKGGTDKPVSKPSQEELDSTIDQLFG